MSYRVVAPLVIAKDRDGRPHHVYEGSVIQWLSDEQAEHFLGTGLVETVGDGVASGDGGEPAKSAPKSEWVEYAVGDGYDRGEVEAMTKAEIQALFD